jgi:hypothetical protein
LYPSISTLLRALKVTQLRAVARRMGAHYNARLHKTDIIRILSRHPLCTKELIAQIP